MCAGLSVGSGVGLCFVFKRAREAFMICPSFLGLFKSSLTMVREGLLSKC